MKPLFDFLLKLCILSVILWAVIFTVLGHGSVDYRSVFYAWIMVASNTVTGYLLFDYAFDKEQQVFTKVVFGGLVIRMLLLMVLIAVVIVRDLAPVINDFVLSFFAFYCIYVIVEILGYQKKNKQKKNAA